MYGPERLLKDIAGLGYAAEKIVRNGATFVVIPNYEILLGKFQGRVIDLGIQATNDFPITVAPA